MGLELTIIGKGKSKDLPPVGLVIRLKKDPGVCDYRCARSLVFKQSEVFLHFADIPKWVDYYKQFSAYKPSTGLCAIFMAADMLPDAIYLAGFDAVLDGAFIPCHDTHAEKRAIKALDVPVIDLRTNQPISRLCEKSRSEQPERRRRKSSRSETS